MYYDRNGNEEYFITIDEFYCNKFDIFYGINGDMHQRQYSFRI